MLCTWWFLQGFGVPPRIKTTTPRLSLTRDPNKRAKTFAQLWRRLENVSGLAGTTQFPSCLKKTCFPFLH